MGTHKIDRRLDCAAARRKGNNGRQADNDGMASSLTKAMASVSSVLRDQGDGGVPDQGHGERVIPDQGDVDPKVDGDSIWPNLRDDVHDHQICIQS
ncbi:unnamed protein product [Urochloa humidicola]